MIKKLLIACTLVISLVSCDNKDEEKKLDNVNVADENKDKVQPADSAIINGKFAKFDFETTLIDFGTIDEGVIVKKSFKFKNTGEVPLVVSDAKGSCGCTVPEKPAKPIDVNDQDEIKFEFNSNGRVGNINKTITLTANTNPTKTVINIKGVVIAKKKEEEEEEDKDKDKSDSDKK